MDALSLRDFLDGNPTDTKRISDLQKQFAAIWHANKCLKGNSPDQCTLPICPTWRTVLNHYNTCNNGYDCEFNSCAISRALIEHFNNCQRGDCRFCAPLRRHSKKTTSTLVCTAQIQHCSGGPSTSEFAASIVKGYPSDGWRESACTAKAAYFSTYSQDFMDGSSNTSYKFISSSCVRSRYGKKERIQREIIVMLHVQKCAELEQQEDPVQRQNIVCAVPHCPKMKRILIHVAMCNGESCNFPECEVTRTIIQHWLRCPKRCCSVCAPVLDSIPALDGGSHYEMDDKLLALLYTSTNGLIDIVSADLNSLEANNTLSPYGNDNNSVEYNDDGGASPPRSINAKRKYSNDSIRFSSCSSNNREDCAASGWEDKKRRVE